VTLWNLDNIAPVAHNVTIPSLGTTARQIVDISPDGRTLATGDVSETIELWDLTHTNPTPRKVLLPQEVGRGSILFSLDGQVLANIGREVVHVWNLRVEPPTVMYKQNVSNCYIPLFSVLMGVYSSVPLQKEKAVCLWI
jgi:WD40 repeat protein